MALLVGVVLLVTHGSDLYDSATKPPPGHDIAVPDKALPDDDAFAAVLKFAEPVDEVFDTIRTNRKRQDKDCGGLATQRPVDWPCVDAVVRDAAGPLKAFDAWLVGPARYKLGRPPDLDRHIRIQGIDFSKDWFFTPQPNFTAVRSLGKAVAYRSLTKRRAGDVAGAERDLRTIFALGSFLQQNPLVVPYMVGLAVHNDGLGVLVTHLPAEAITPGLDGLLPAPQPYVEGMKGAIGAEWLGLREYIQNGLAGLWGTPDFGSGGVIENVPLKVWNVLGFYSRPHTLRLLAGDTQTALLNLDTGIMASSSSKDYWAQVCSVGDWKWPVVFVRNPVGRLFTCLIGFSWDPYLGRIGQAMDRLSATQVILAARRFKHQHGRWPAQETDLVPAYLKAWPMSALDGQPLRWLDDKTGVLVLGDDGKKPCEPHQWCRFAFAPAAPVAKATASVRERTSRR